MSFGVMQILADLQDDNSKGGSDNTIDSHFAGSLTHSDGFACALHGWAIMDCAHFTWLCSSVLTAHIGFTTRADNSHATPVRCICQMTNLQDDDSKGRNDDNSLHFCKGAPKGHAMLVLLQHRLVVLGISWVMRKEVVKDAQSEADYAHCQEHHPPTLNAKWTIPT